jgi:hypothetical protein
MRRISALTVLLMGGTVALATPAAAQSPADDLSIDQLELLAAVRQATERFQDVSVALAEGYIPDPAGHCVTAEDVGAPAEWGAMGIHYLHPALMKLDMPAPGTRVFGHASSYDPLRPEVLVYEPQADGSLQLVAVEYLVFKEAWYEGGNARRPDFAGYDFEEMEDDPATEMDEAHGFEPHYELHVWLYRDNPTGMFAEFNPLVTCPRAHDARH